MKMITYILSVLKGLFKEEEKKFSLFNPSNARSIYSPDRLNTTVVSPFSDIVAFTNALLSLIEFIEAEQPTPSYYKDLSYEVYYLIDLFRVNERYVDNPDDLALTFLETANRFVELYDNMDEENPDMSYNKRNLHDLRKVLDHIGGIFDGGIAV